MGKVLHASGSGYFPGCIAAGDPEDCPWTLEKAMQTYWRVRTWTFTASGIVTESQDSSDSFPFSSTITGIISHEVETGLMQTQEEGLVCNNYFQNLNPNPNDDFYSFIEFKQPKTGGGLYNSGFVGEVVDNRIYPLEFVFPAIGSTIFDISILDTDIPINMIYVNDEVGFTYDITSGSATLTPTEWWSYGGTYDISTGEPL